MTQSDPKHARIKAWLHWKRLELKGHPNEDIQLFVDEIESLLNENQRLRDALEEFTLPPYHDSDLASLLTTMRVRAKSVLERK